MHFCTQWVLCSGSLVKKLTLTNASHMNINFIDLIASLACIYQCIVFPLKFFAFSDEVSKSLIAENQNNYSIQSSWWILILITQFKIKNSNAIDLTLLLKINFICLEIIMLDILEYRKRIQVLFKILFWKNELQIFLKHYHDHKIYLFILFK